MSRSIALTIIQDVNVDEDWKLITLWIGGNDLCAVCKGNVKCEVRWDWCQNISVLLIVQEKNTPENYSAKIKEALNILKEVLTRSKSYRHCIAN